MRLIVQTSGPSMMSSSTIAVFAVTSMHEHVHEWTCEQQQIRKDAKQVCPMFCKKEEADDCQERQQHNASA